MSESWVNDYDKRLDREDKAENNERLAYLRLKEEVKAISEAALKESKSEYTKELESFLLEDEKFCRCDCCLKIDSADCSEKITDKYKGNSYQCCATCADEVLRPIESEFDIEF